jgi:hypothetical protein
LLPGDIATVNLCAAMNRHCVLFACILCMASGASAQTPNGRLLPATAREQAAFLVQTQLADTSRIQRAVALNLLRRAADSVQQAALPLIGNALRDSSDVVRGRALGALERLGVAASPLIGMVIELALNPREVHREYAIELIAELGGPRPDVVTAMKSAGNDESEDVRLAAAEALRRVGDTAAARSIYHRALSTDNVETRLRIGRALAELGDSAAVRVLRPFLADTTFRHRTQSALALGKLGPKAHSAVPELTRLLEDTVLRRIPQGRAWVLESAAPYAAWALSQLIPFRSASSNAVIDPLHVVVVDGANALRGDGKGVYAWGVDSVAVFRGSGLFFMLSPLGDARGPLGATNPTFRRSLSFDLTRPVPESGARSVGTVSDNEAYTWIWYKRDPETDRVSTFRELGVSDSIHMVERVEIHFRIDGVLHELQMGPFVEGQGGATQWYTGVHGDGTTLAQFIHPENNVWIVRAPPGSRARLWSFENRARPVDRGLYFFPLELRFRGMPGGAAGACVPTPSSCYRSFE